MFSDHHSIELRHEYYHNGKDSSGSLGETSLVFWQKIGDHCITIHI